MTTTYTNANEALLGQLHRLKEFGHRVKSRNGETTELLMENFTVHNIADRYITVPGRKVSLPAQIAETMWILSGRNDIEFLSHYLPRAKDFSDDGVTWRGGYGPRLRAFGENRVDQLGKVVELLQQDLHTRRAVINIFDGNVDHTDSKDIPCNNWLHFIYRDGALNLHVATRSNDVIWGWSGINGFEWSVLLEVVSKLVGVAPGSITYSVSSFHLYDHHKKKADFIIDHGGSLTPVYDTLSSFLWFKGVDSIDSLDKELENWFALEEAIRTDPTDKDLRGRTRRELKDPLFRVFAQCLHMWHAQDFELYPYLGGTDILMCLELSPKPKKKWGDDAPSPAVVSDGLVGFPAELDALHREKNAAYGDSWCRRGEILGIMANLARKVDRLGADGGGETALDTSSDLLLYLLKYRVFLASPGRIRSSSLFPWSWERSGVSKYFDKVGLSHPGGTFEVRPLIDDSYDGVVKDINDPGYVTTQLEKLSQVRYSGCPQEKLHTCIRDLFRTLEGMVIDHGQRPTYEVDGMSKDDVVEALVYLSLDSALGYRGAVLHDQWKRDNESRFFNGYGDCE